MRSMSAAPALAAAMLVAVLGGCALPKEEVLAIVQKRIVGMPAGDFFDRWGRARSRVEIAGGTTEYDWLSAVPEARPGPEGLDEHVCRLRLTSDARGRIQRAQILYDAPGLKSTSRCAELFASP
ncbi:MAG: hypothetical protein ACXWVF_05455 [Telluria sp.]